MTSEDVWMVLLFPAGVLAGTFNVLAGGGSFLSLPVLMAAGLPIEVANGTNRISVALQGLFAAYDFKKKDSLDGPLYREMLPPLLLGAVGGAWLATQLDPERLKRVFGAVFLLMAVVLVYRRRRARRRAHPAKDDGAKDDDAQEDGAPGARAPHALRYLALFFVGIYGGFIQAGVGLWILLSGVSLFARDAVRVNSVKLPLTLTFTVPALVLFLLADLVEWIPGLILAVGTVLGTAIGVRLTLKGGEALIFRAVTLVLLLTGTHLLLFQ